MFWAIRRYHVDSNNNRLKTDDFDESWEIHPKAVEILRDKMHDKDLQHLLKSLISKNMYHEGQYGLHDKFVNEVFKDIFWLKEIVRSNEHTDNGIKGEFLDFASRYEQAKGFIEYNFKCFEID